MLDVNVLGSKTVLDNLDAFGADIQSKAQEKLAAAAEMAKELAEQMAPVSENETPGHVHMRDRMLMDVQPGIAYIGNAAIYALFVELGTSKARAQPFLRPAWIEAGNWLKDELKGIVE